MARRSALRLMPCLLVVALAGGIGAVAAGCGSGDEQTQHQDDAPDDFQKHWRSYVSNSAELALPVTTPAGLAEWAPILSAECVSSGEALAAGPTVSLDTLVTLSWNDPAPADGEAPPVRFDVSLDDEGLDRNHYASILGTDVGQRFALPSTSGLIDDLQALFTVGEGLFPWLVGYRTQRIQDRTSGASLLMSTLQLRSFSGGLSYSLRMDVRDAFGWTEARRTVLLAPVCPTSF